MRLSLAMVFLVSCPAVGQMALVQVTPHVGADGWPVLDAGRGTVLGLREGSGLTIGEWDGATWTPSIASTVGASGELTGCAYDAARQRVVAVRSDSVIEWDGQSFTIVNGVASPESEVCYDAQRQAVVGLGTRNGQVRLLGWNGSQWLVDPSAPAPFSASSMLVYDARGVRLVAMPIVPNTLPPGVADSAWELAGQGWSQLPNPGGYFGSVRHPVYDSVTQSIICVGGTQRLVGSTWSDVSISGAGPHGIQAYFSTTMTYRFAVDAGGNIVWFRGSVYSSLRPSQAQAGSLTTYGQGCPGPLGLPTLELSGEGPWVGAGFSLTLTNVPPFGLAYPYMMAGFGNQTVLGAPIPLELTTYGMPGCYLLTSADFLLLHNRMDVTVPPLASFIGLPLYFQGASMNMLGPNGPGMAFTEGYHAVLGVPQ